MLHLIIIFVSFACLIGLNVLFCYFIGLGALYGFLASLIGVLAVVLIDGIVAFLSHKLPKKIINPFSKMFAVSKAERHFYEKLKIKKWKDKLLDLGFLCGFRKNKILNPTDKNYILRYLNECVYGEICHIVSIFCSIGVFFIFGSKFLLSLSLPLFLVNALLNIMPTFALRYNRSKLIVLYKKLERDEEKDFQKNCCEGIKTSC